MAEDIHVYGFCEDKCRREVMLKADLDAKFSEIDTSITNIGNGTTKVKNAEHADSATSADSATNATNAENATNATNAANADSAASADKATKLATARKINGVAFDGTSDITVEDNTKAPASHTHDDRYYTETEVNNLLAEKAATNHSHGSMSTITFAAAEPTTVAAGEIVMVYET